MRRICFAACVAFLSLTATASAQMMMSADPQTGWLQTPVGTPGIQYSHTIAAGEGAQMYPYDQQDPWLHGHFQRIPAYGGFSSFRPYNYRHVFAQTQISAAWGSAHGMPYSQQFWNKYRASYLNGDLHAQAPIHSMYPTHPAPRGDEAASPLIPAAQSRPVMSGVPVRQISHPTQLPTAPLAADGRPVHVFPGQ